MSDVMLKPEEKMVRKVTNREVRAEEATLQLWPPPWTDDPEWQCTEEAHQREDALCYQCYGTGVRNGYVENYHILVRDVRYEEVIGADGEPRWEDDFTSLTFECPLRYHVFYGCIFLFDNRPWRVTDVKQIEEDEDDDGNLLPERWEVWCRKMESFEGGYAFLAQLPKE